ncbi:MAG: hypothetical protein RR795_01610 [Cetobacterium sp.]|uniref:hypothetical protein n=1 Tax=Cetobacterium sp. TaxID=2071632 RepID=UPI002FC84E0C
MAMNDETSSGFGGMGLGFIIVLFLLFIVFGGGLFGNRALANDVVVNGGCNARSNCEIEKQEIIDSARNFWQIGNEGAQTRALLIQESATTRANDTANANMVATKIDFYAYQGLRDELADTKSQLNMEKQGRYMDAQFSSLKMENADIRCAISKLPTTAKVYAQGVSECGQPFPTPRNGGCLG